MGCRQPDRRFGLRDDFLGVLQSTGQSKAIIVGHDWGSAVVWAFALKYPQHTTALVTFAVPHLELYRSYNTFRLPFSLTHVWYFLFYGLTGPAARWKAAKDDMAWFTKFENGASARAIRAPSRKLTSRSGKRCSHAPSRLGRAPP